MEEGRAAADPHARARTRADRGRIQSHFTQATADYLEKPRRRLRHVAVGSCLKFCIVAEGKADIYPRLSPTSEWDTAAGHAVLLAAGGRVDGPDGQPLRYGKQAFLNRGFRRHGGLAGAADRAVSRGFRGRRGSAAGRLEPFVAASAPWAEEIRSIRIESRHSVPRPNRRAARIRPRRRTASRRA